MIKQKQKAFNRSGTTWHNLAQPYFLIFIERMAQLARLARGNFSFQKIYEIFTDLAYFSAFLRFFWKKSQKPILPRATCAKDSWLYYQGLFLPVPGSVPPVPLCAINLFFEANKVL